jgi:L-seryl-tRNA(Ser) seleniumtransferase
MKEQPTHEQRSELQRIARVDETVAHPQLAAARQRLGQAALTRFVRLEIGEVRRRVLAGGLAATPEELVAAVQTRVDLVLATRARRVINATGVVLHTNLGRAPLSDRIASEVAASSTGYVSIELDLTTGRRGPRGAFAETAVAQLSGADAALVVNNNAAAVLLALTALAKGRGVIVSRGELVEIGGGFRVPDVLARSGAKMIEVGTTNRTKLSDYARVFDDPGSDVAVILRVHQGNFKQLGFVERPPLSKIAALAHEHGVLLVKDLGGGALVDLAAWGLPGEPTPAACIEAGADLVCFSGDKVLGGPQAGILVGDAASVECARRDPLARALRLGRLPLVALEAVLDAYLRQDHAAVPALVALRRPPEEVEQRAAAWVERLRAAGLDARVIDVPGAVGAGALAEVSLPSFAVALQVPHVEPFAAALRAAEPAVLPRIRDDLLLFDARSVLDGEDELLIAAIIAAHRGLSAG